ncbi:MAG: aldo/keto reductase [Candidatus Bathyarchaeia archaeon]|jgi:aryl-alcohol dehydrogenase-like predicted oxidoreductase
MSDNAVPRRRFKSGVELSVIGFGGMIVVGLAQKEANQIVADAVSQGINYFDVAPQYGEGEAEQKMGPALQPYREDVFLACKTLRRDAQGAREELDRSLKRLRTDHFDLYQFHAIVTMEEVERIFAPGGAIETFIRAREEGKVRFIGFSAHSTEAALAMMDRFDFDSILFPINFVCYGQGGFGPQVVQRAKEKGVARLALKAMAHGPWPEGAERKYPKCWYLPLDDREAGLNALRFTLSEGVTAIIPPGDERLYRLALELTDSLEPLTAKERELLLASTQGWQPLFRTGSN